MKKWPRTLLAHAVIAFIGATILAILTFRPILEMRMATYVRQYPHDGQDSLGAFLDACAAALVIEIGSGFFLFVLQRKISSRPSS
jgi:hypothetical protein